MKTCPQCGHPVADHYPDHGRAASSCATCVDEGKLTVTMSWSESGLRTCCWPARDIESLAAPAPGDSRPSLAQAVAGLADAYLYLHRNDNPWRHGQALFNALSALEPDRGEYVCGGELDPFNLDERIPAFLAYLADEV